MKVIGFARTVGLTSIRASSIRAIAIMTNAVETNRIFGSSPSWCVTPWDAGTGTSPTKPSLDPKRFLEIECPLMRPRSEQNCSLGVFTSPAFVRRGPQRLTDGYEIVIQEMQRNRMAMISNFFAEPMVQPAGVGLIRRWSILNRFCSQTGACSTWSRRCVPRGLAAI
jgi:hypothetical protein